MHKFNLSPYICKAGINCFCMKKTFKWILPTFTNLIFINSSVSFTFSPLCSVDLFSYDLASDEQCLLYLDFF